MLKKISICSNALLLLGHKPINSFDEPGAGPLLSKNLWEPTVDNMLSINTWTFARHYNDLNRLPEENPTPMYKYIYQLPSDYIRIDTTEPVSDYEIFGDKLYSNSNKLGLYYYRRVPEELFPPYFVRLMEYEMASVLATPLTVDATKAQLYKSFATTQLQTAMSTDAQGQPPKSFADTPTTSTRFY